MLACGGEILAATSLAKRGPPRAGCTRPAARAADGAAGSTVNPADEATIAESTSTLMVVRVIVAGLSAGIMIFAEGGG